MISLGGLALTGSVLYGGIKALRNLQRQQQSRPIWLRENNLATLTLEASDGSRQAVYSQNLFVTTSEAAESDSLLNHLIHNKEERQVSIVMLTSSTALIHILLGLQGGIPIFIWNGAGYLALLTGRYFVPQLAPYQQALTDGLIAYTGVTIIAYFAVLGPVGLLNVAGISTKFAEAGLIGLLWHEAGAE